MIEPLANLPAGVIGFGAAGEVHSADCADVLIPAVDEAAAAGGVRLVYVSGEKFTGYGRDHTTAMMNEKIRASTPVSRIVGNDVPVVDSSAAWVTT